MKAKQVIQIIIISILFLCNGYGQDKKSSKDTILIYHVDVMESIDKPVWRTMQKGFDEAYRINADYIFIHMNTYGGRVDIADSMRTKILNSPVPVMVFIDNQAISAGALIAIACDSIYMRPGASIGAATVVNQTGEQVPDKYQSFMRSTMRATAEAHGKDTIISGNDTIIRWHRDPKIAEAMVDPAIEIHGIDSAGQVLTFTAEEALRYHYCEGIAGTIKEVFEKAGIKNYEIREYKASGIDKIIGFLLSPVVQGLLIMVIIGGIYFELQTPGVGFPLAAAAVAALFYFAPLYLEGLAQNWELLVFIAGAILLGVEILVIPGFGVAGISGILLIIVGLTFAMIDNVVFKYEGAGAFNHVLESLLIVVISIILSFFLSLYLSRKVLTAKSFKLALSDVQNRSEGFIGIDLHQKELIGKKGIAFTDLRPSGRIEIEGEIYDAKAEVGYIEKGKKIKVIRDETGQLYVIKDDL